MYGLVRTASPASTPVTTAEAKAQLRIDHNDDDAFIAALIEAATSHVDGWSGILGRALLTQTWRGSLDAFPEDREAIDVPLLPLQSVTAITYVDGDGTTQTLDPAVYRVLDNGTERGAIAPAFGEAWPETQDRLQAVTVTFVAGYGAAADVPQAIRQAILLLVSHWYERRVVVEMGTVSAEMPYGVQAMLQPFRMVGFQ